MLEKEILELCSKEIKDQEKLVKLQALIKKGANVNVKDEQGNSPLINAVKNGNDRAVLLLLQRSVAVYWR